MKSSINNVQLLGYLGADPEIKQINEDNTIVKLRLATNETFKDKSGQYQTKTQWHSIVAWNRMAQDMSEQLSKGSRVYIHGCIENNSWKDAEGTTRYTTNIKAQDFFLVSTPKNAE